jgi:hypothetical protein
MPHCEGLYVLDIESSQINNVNANKIHVNN